MSLCLVIFPSALTNEGKNLINLSKEVVIQMSITSLLFIFIYLFIIIIYSMSLSFLKDKLTVGFKFLCKLVEQNRIFPFAHK